MKILVIDEWLPSMRNSGKSIRTYELLSPFAKKHQITYLAHIDGKEQPEYLRQMQETGFNTVCVPRRKRYASALSAVCGAVPALLNSLPISVLRHYSPDFAAKIQELIRRESFDLMHIEWSHYAVYSWFATQVPQFICTHNVEYLSWKRFAGVAKNPFKIALGLHEAAKMYYFEKEAYNRVAHISAVSEEDAEIVRKKFGIQDVAVIPNGVGIAMYDEVPNTPNPNLLIYCGSLDAFVNVDAVDYFLRDIFPLILKRKPETIFTVIGRNPPLSLLKYQSKNIVFTGSVADVRIPLKEGAVEVVPLRIAGGSRLKILEAFAAKIPVVSTSIGAEGLEIEDGKNIILADTPETFADKTIALLENEALRKTLIDNGRKLADEKYDWSMISPRVEQAWLRTIEKHNTIRGLTSLEVNYS